MRLPAGLFALALTAGLALADKPDPKKVLPAATDAAKAVNSGDMKSIREKTVGSPAAYDRTEADTKLATAYRAFESAIVRKFGEKEKGQALKEAPTEIDVNQIAQTKIEIRDETACLLDQKSRFGLVLKWAKDSWKLDLDDQVTQQPDALREYMMNCYCRTSAFEETAKAIDADKFSKAQDAHTAFISLFRSKRELANAQTKPTTATTKP